VDESRNKNLMVILDPAIPMLALETAIAMNLLGEEVFRPVKSNEKVPSQSSEFQPGTSSLKKGDSLPKARHEEIRFDRIEEVSELGDSGNLVYAKHRPKIARPSLLLHPLLEGQNARVLPKHHGQTGKDDINERKHDLILLPIVRNFLKLTTKVLHERVKLKRFWSISHASRKSYRLKNLTFANSFSPPLEIGSISESPQEA
jgi:hypothetical protein